MVIGFFFSRAVFVPTRKIILCETPAAKKRNILRSSAKPCIDLKKFGHSRNSNIDSWLIHRIPVAKLVDIWGRGEGFMLMAAFATFGLALTAVCSNVAVCVIAQVFYAAGTHSANYILHVIMADASSLRNRALAFGFATTPYLLTAFAVNARPSLKASSDVAIRRRASPECASSRDLLSSSTLSGPRSSISGLALILIPLGLKCHYADGRHDTSLLGQCIAGATVLFLFWLWESRHARIRLISYRAIASRTVAGSCLLCSSCFVATGCYHTYLLSFLQVVHRLGIRDAGYIANASSLTACVCGVSVAWSIRQTGRFEIFGLLAQPIRALQLLAIVPAVARGPAAAVVPEITRIAFPDEQPSTWFAVAKAESVSEALAVS
ncbi:hypothetical protein B0J12DRAFT_757499 [Macrophomina phaseolina]|uniref:Major facilitator superfamily domain general substrate transporter n=1 Tax=Macrophomina phaseolina TaxID=35725 RepID=A0ABQ8G6G6_9PEZI|nr:hypothetical protein B0J12DRAFT_757499 [Macrophomina phaseolina]